jgi:hypothetical protein
LAFYKNTAEFSRELATDPVMSLRPHGEEMLYSSHFRGFARRSESTAIN